MKKIYAPWRSEYIKNPSGEGCIFCKAAESKDDRKWFVLSRGEHSFAMMNRYPYTNGHIMIAPYKHTGNLQELRLFELNELMELLQRWQAVISKAINPDGFNIGMNIGRTAGAGFEDHLHFHLVPRWRGDTNFMPVVAETKVIPVSLLEGYALLKSTYEQEFKD
ncbi:MAG: HIT domain-containing protein [candidate division WOR-3 bacterium]|nr:HIT domain-containing protein [candidate division WOR-3 bacterium]